MNAILAAVRRFALGGIIVSILEQKYFYILISSFLYLLFLFFTWLSGKHSTEKLSRRFGVLIPVKGFFPTLLKGLLIDVFSPIGVIIDLFRKTENRIIMLILTYVAFIASIIVFGR